MFQNCCEFYTFLQIFSYSLAAIYSVAFDYCCRSTVFEVLFSRAGCVLCFGMRDTQYCMVLFQDPLSSPYLNFSHIKDGFVRKMWGNRFTIKCVYMYLIFFFPPVESCIISAGSGYLRTRGYYSGGFFETQTSILNVNQPWMD